MTPIDPLMNRVPPQNLEAEQSALGSMMLESYAVEKARNILQAEDFYREAHRQLFETVIALADRHEPVDLTTLTEELRRIQKLEVVGGIPYLSSLLHIVPSPANVEHYATIVRDKATLRMVISAATQIEAMGFDARDGDQALTAGEVMDRAQQMFVDITTRRQKRSSMITLSDALFRLQEKTLATKEAGPGCLMGVPTGYPTLDFVTLGYHPEQFVIVTGLTGKGKTALALDMTCSAAKADMGDVLVFSAEMSVEQVVRRMVSQDGRVDGYRIKASYLMTNEDWEAFFVSLGRMDPWPVRISDRSGLSIADIRSDCYQAFSQRGKIGLIVVDYIQLVVPARGANSREQEVATIAGSLKGLARDFQCPVLALSQLNDDGQVRESRAIEHHADIHLTLQWGKVDVDSTTGKKPDLIDVTLSVKKHRDGQTIDIPMKFNGPLTQFTEVTGDR